MKEETIVPAIHLRAGQYRVLFEIENEQAITVYRITHHRSGSFFHRPKLTPVRMGAACAASQSTVQILRR